MEQLGSQIFTFTWRVENFSMLPHLVGEEFASPSFVVDFLKNTEWKLVMYPCSSVYTDSLSVYLCGGPDVEYLQNITVLISSSLSTDCGKDIAQSPTSKTLTLCDDSTRILCAERSKIFKNESEPLPYDALTFKCHLSKCIEKQEGSDTVHQDLNTDCWILPKKFECTARTRVKVSSASFVWGIKRIGEFPCDVKLSTSMSVVMKSERSLHLFLYWKKDSEGNKKIHLEICRKHVDKEAFFVRCHIRTDGNPRHVLFEKRDEHFFKGGKKDVWEFPSFLESKDLAESYFKHTGGALYLRFDFKFSNQNDLVDIESTSERFPSYVSREKERPRISTSNLQKLYIDGEFVDVTLRLQKREFKVHKLILIAESDVFHRMFQSGMKEERSGVVDIDDLDADTMERLLKYMYTQQLEELGTQDVVKLYSAANKYNVGSLKNQLSSRLAANLSVNTVCEVLILSDMYQDEDMLASVGDYIYKNAYVIFHSTIWKEFTKTRSDLAASIMLQVFTKQ